MEVCGYVKRRWRRVFVYKEKKVLRKKKCNAEAENREVVVQWSRSCISRRRRVYPFLGIWSPLSRHKPDSSIPPRDRHHPHFRSQRMSVPVVIERRERARRHPTGRCSRSYVQDICCIKVVLLIHKWMRFCLIDGDDHDDDGHDSDECGSEEDSWYIASILVPAHRLGDIGSRK